MLALGRVVNLCGCSEITNYRESQRTVSEQTLRFADTSIIIILRFVWCYKHEEAHLSDLLLWGYKTVPNTCRLQTSEHNVINIQFYFRALIED